MNPYSGTGVFSFFTVLVGRLPTLLQGLLGGTSLPSDEIQILVLVTLGVSSGLLGALLVLRRMTMLANSLSHTILLGIVAAYLVSQWGMSGEILEQGPLPLAGLMVASALTAIATTFLTESLTRWFRLSEEASTGLVFTALFAAGIVFVTLFTRNAHIGIEVVMGNADGLSRDDVLLGVSVLGLNLLLVWLLRRSYLVTTFDAGFATLLGFRPILTGYILMAQVGLSVVAGFRAVGVLMILALLVGPPLAARRWVRSLQGLMGVSAAIGGMCGLLAVWSSRALLTHLRLPLSTGALTVAWVSLWVLVSFLADGWRRSRWFSSSLEDRERSLWGSEKSSN